MTGLEKGEDLPEVTKAYATLPEPLRRKLAKGVHSKAPKLFDRWLRKAGLHKGGFQPHKVAARETDLTRKRLDGVCSNPEEQDFLCSLVMCFFFEVEERVKASLGVTVPEQKEKDASLGMRQMLEKFNIEFQDDPMFKLYQVVSQKTGTSYTGDEDIKGQLLEIRTLISELDKKMSCLVEDLDPLRHARRIDRRSIEAQLEKAEQTSLSIRERLKEVADYVGFEFRDWDDEEGLLDFISDLALRLKEKEFSTHEQSRIMDLAEKLTAYAIQHRSKQQEKTLAALKEASVKGLREAAGRTPVPNLPGPVDISSWFDWALNLEGDELDKAQNELSKINEDLAQFIGICELAWLRGPGDEEKGGEPPEPVKEKGSDDEIRLGREVENTGLEEETESDLLVAGEEEDAGPSDESLEAKEDEEVVTETQEPEKPAPEEMEGEPNWEKKDISTLAKAVLNSAEKTGILELQMLVVKLLEQREEAAAYHLARLSEEMGEQNSNRFSSWIIKTLIIGQNLPFGIHEMTDLLRQTLANYHDKILEADMEWNSGIRLLLVAGTLRPALLAPMTTAPSLLQRINLGETKRLSDLVNAIVRYGNIAIPLPRSSLRKAWTISEWQKEMDDVVLESREWLAQASNLSIISRPGRGIWRNWVSKGGPVYEMLSPVTQNKPRLLDVVEDRLREWPDTLESDAKFTHRKELKHHGELLRPALNQIKRHTMVAIGLADRWRNLLSEKPDPRGSYDERQVVELRENIDAYYEAAMQELNDIVNEDRPLPMCVASILCRDSLRSLKDMFDGVGGETFSTMQAAELLNGSLLRVPEITLGPDWEPEGQESEHFGAVLRQLEKGLPALPEAFDLQDQRENHEATAKIVELLRKAKEDTDQLEKLEKRRDNSIREGRAALFRGIGDSQRLVSEGLNKGLITDEEYEQWAAELSSYERKLKMPEEMFLRFFEVRQFFDEISSTIDNRRDTEVEKIREKLTDKELDEKVKTRIEGVLSHGDIYTANDYIERIRAGKDLPEAMAMSGWAFLDLFKPGDDGSRFSKIERALSDINPAIFVERIKTRKGIPGVEMRDVAGTQAKQYASILGTWLQVKRTRKITTDDAGRIFQGLGINPIHFKIQTTGQRTWIHLEAETITECPVSEYGSTVKGEYQILCEWGIPNEEELLTAFRDTPHGSGWIVFYFGRMTEARRRAAARICRQDNLRVIVLDDILLAYLSGVRGSRLRVLFECVLPFTHLSPYSVSSSLLPREMFYGRRKQIESLISDQSSGSCLLYGGRQIGKTVLLRHVEHIFMESREKEYIAKFVDLKVKGIGSSRPLDDLWAVLGTELADHGIIEGKLPAQTSFDWLSKQIEKWLNEKPGRRLLFLLDEADLFLESDGIDRAGGREEFSRSAMIRGLMEKTNRRFKVVFSGLHNVQRSTFVANNPLAQFGEPICIGPMLSNGESLEAERLITTPLGSLGYFFESPNLVARILAQTNYYPNLIQIYCHKLLDYLVEKGKGLFDHRSTPPFLITSSMIDDVYERHDLRESLKDKFELTLNLDLRFRLIAHILAYYYDDEGVYGFSVEWIRSEALYFWEAGFKESSGGDRILSSGAFRNLLNEMVGLGILIRTEEIDHYALRSPNVVSLLGSRDQILEVIMSSQEWEPPGEYEPATFRCLLDEEDKSLRSPLTAAQEAELKGKANQVVLLFGCPASGINDVPRAVIHRFGSEYVFQLQTEVNPVDFEKKLNVLEKRGREGTTVILVSSHLPWTRRWIEIALKKARKLRIPKATVTFLFVCDPKKAWDIVAKGDFLREKRLLSMHLQPWQDAAVRQWLEDGPLGPQDSATRSEIEKSTGNWPMLLYKIHQRVGANSLDQETLHSFIGERRSSQSLKNDLFRAFGLELQEPTSVLKTLANYGDELEMEDLLAVFEESEPERREAQIARSLRWANLMDLAQESHGRWYLDPIVKDLLSANE